MRLLWVVWCWNLQQEGNLKHSSKNKINSYTEKAYKDINVNRSPGNQTNKSDMETEKNSKLLEMSKREEWNAVEKYIEI